MPVPLMSAYHRCLKPVLRGIFLLAATVFLFACSTASPQLERLYQTSRSLPGQPPVILIHGAFGGRLCRQEEELWPGSLADLAFGDYQQLTLPVGRSNEGYSLLEACGITGTVAGRDFYGDIENTLISAGGYQMTLPGTAVHDDQRRYYRFDYDWRQDNVSSARKLDQLVEQIRLDYKQPDLQVDIVAHSMGGLLTRYWLRYGTEDVLNNNDFPVNNNGADKTRKVILVGTPNLGSTSALQQILRGADFGINTLKPEILLTFPSAYQLLPHPIVDAVLNNAGEPLNRDLFDINVWQALEWGPYDPQIIRRLTTEGWQPHDLQSLQAYTATHLERARRFVWSLTVDNPDPRTELIVFGGDCYPTPARILIEDIGDKSFIRLWPGEISRSGDIDYESLMLEPGDGAVTKASLLARTALDPSVPRHRFSDFPLHYSVMFCDDHSRLPGNLTFQDNLLHILLSN